MDKRIFFALLIMAIGFSHLKAQTNENIVIDSDIQLVRIADSIFVHITWDNSVEYGRYSSNGMIIIRNGQAIMIDTPTNNEKTKKIAEYLLDSMHVELSKLIIGHFHNDCLGGLEYIQSKGIESIANILTVQKCKELELPIPSTSFQDSLIIDFNNELIVCRFFGGGHTFDNITVWIPSEKILFGGCLIKSMESRGLGNLSDAVVGEWDNTVKKIINKYPKIQVVVPGHGAIGGSQLLSHTIELVEKQKSK